MQNKTKPQIFLFSIIFFLFLSFIGCSDTPTTDETPGATITPISTTEIKLVVAGKDFWFVKIPINSGHLWVSKRELSREQYNSLMAVTTPDSAKYPKSLNWYDAARISNIFSKVIDDTVIAKGDSFLNFVSLIKPLYTDTTKDSLVRAVAIKIVGYAAAFNALSVDIFKNLEVKYQPLRVTHRDSLLQQIALLDSFKTTKVDTLVLKNALLRAPDSVYVTVKNDSVLLSVRRHIRNMIGPSLIDTMLIDTIIKVMNAAKIDTPYSVKTFRHILTDKDSVSISPSLPQGAVLRSINGGLISANLVYFPILPPDSLMKLFGSSIVLPAPCTLNTHDSAYTIKLWNRAAGIGIRLPTIFEWEQAALCGTNAFQYSTNTGNLNLESAVYGQSGPSETYGNSERLLSPNGLADMTGNLYEWTEDWYYKPYKALKGGYYGNAAQDSSLLSLLSTAAEPDSTFGNKAGVRLVIESTPAIDSLFMKLKQ